ncbi:MAG: DUF4350 domain-containing protein [Pyrinomonadaceae bacterium]
MRERLFIIGSIVALLALLAGLNAASYVRVEREPELEARPDRSTYNAGPTGTRALYEYLSAAGRSVVRWREPAAALVDFKHRRPDTFVLVGRLRVSYTKEDAAKLQQWVAAGGRLVVIDRIPNTLLLPPPADFTLETDVPAMPAGNVRADNVENLTAGAKPIAPTQPTLLTRDVEQIAPSRFAGRIKLKPARAPAATAPQNKSAMSDDDFDDETDEEESPSPQPSATTQQSTPTPQPAPSPTVRGGVGPGVGSQAATADEAEAKEPSPATAPVFHITDEQGALLADYVVGRGHVIVLSDPFIVANNGIERADNLQLALNVIASSSGDGGLIAFDEYHQGRAATENQLLAYFAGTPVLALCGQAVLLVCALVWTRGRRFARPLPAPRIDRRSKLEFVASMAELQQRARAYDLAIENIYARTRRALARYGGASQNVPRQQLAARVAARSGLKQADLEALMRACEDAINGAPLKAAQALALVHRLRELEAKLGIRMRAREIRQSARL